MPSSSFFVFLGSGGHGTSDIHVGDRADHFQKLGKGIFPVVLVVTVAAVEFPLLLEMAIQQTAAAEVVATARHRGCILKQHTKVREGSLEGILQVVIQGRRSGIGICIVLPLDGMKGVLKESHGLKKKIILLLDMLLLLGTSVLDDDFLQMSGFQRIGILLVIGRKKSGKNIQQVTAVVLLHHLVGSIVGGGSTCRRGTSRRGCFHEPRRQHGHSLLLLLLSSVLMQGDQAGRLLVLQHLRSKGGRSRRSSDHVQALTLGIALFCLGVGLSTLDLAAFLLALTAGAVVAQGITKGLRDFFSGEVFANLNEGRKKWKSGG